MKKIMVISLLLLMLVITGCRKTATTSNSDVISSSIQNRENIEESVTVERCH